MNISNKINGDSYIITVFITFFLNSYIIFSKFVYFDVHADCDCKTCICDTAKPIRAFD
jgi:hypothetical protein